MASFCPNEQDSNDEASWGSEYSKDSNYTESTSCEDTNQVRIVLVGSTGSGKSATGNTILNGSYFKSELNLSSVTSSCRSIKKEIFGKNVQVVDTPGLFDTRDISNTATENEILKCVHMTSPGPHCFLLVVEPCRFTKEHKEGVDRLFEHFGNDVFRYFIILFTKKDEIDRSYKRLEDFIAKVPFEFSEIIRRCKNRCIAFNNIASSNDRCNQVQDLLTMIDHIVQENGGFYTNVMYMHAERRMIFHELRIKKEREEKMERELEELRLKMKHMEINDEKRKETLLEELREKHRNLPSIRDEAIQNIERDATSFFNLASSIFNFGQAVSNFLDG